VHLTSYWFSPMLSVICFLNLHAALLAAIQPELLNYMLALAPPCVMKDRFAEKSLSKPRGLVPAGCRLTNWPYSNDQDYFSNFNRCNQPQIAVKKVTFWYQLSIEELVLDIKSPVVTSSKGGHQTKLLALNHVSYEVIEEYFFINRGHAYHPVSSAVINP